MAAETYEIEFIGGPYDGYVHVSSISPREFDAVLAVPLSRKAMRHAKIDLQARTRPDRNAALYELEQRSGEWRYRFWGVRKGEQHRHWWNLIVSISNSARNCLEAVREFAARDRPVFLDDSERVARPRSFRSDARKKI